MKLLRLLALVGIFGVAGITYQIIENSSRKMISVSWEEVKKLDVAKNLESENLSVSAKSFKNVDEWTFKAEESFGAEKSTGIEYLIGGPSINKIRELSEHEEGCELNSGISEELSRMYASRKKREVGVEEKFED